MWIAWLGLLAMLYPSIAQWFEQSAQNGALTAQLTQTSKLTAAATETRRQSAAAYNGTLAAGGDTSLLSYADALAVPGSDIIARVRIPRIEVDQPLRPGLTDEVLLKGLGHSQSSSLPIGGESTHAVIGGHRGLAASIGFTRLPELVIGDEFEIDVLGETLTYRIVTTEVLGPLEADYRPVRAGKDLVSLLTCTPLGINSHRFVATGERVHTKTEAPATMSAPVTKPPWWAAGLVSATVIAATATGWIIRAGHAQ